MNEISIFGSKCRIEINYLSLVGFSRWIYAMRMYKTRYTFYEGMTNIPGILPKIK